jgi:multiple sugar transport system ATP-binding protein
VAEIGFRGVWKIYGRTVEAVKDMNLQIKNGEFVSLLGPSGCGKSSTLRMVAGLEEITRGDLEIGGRRINDMEPGDRDVAMVFENYALFPHMTSYDNIAFPLSLRGVDREEIRKKVEEISKLLDLDGLLDTLAVNLGGGEKQRVGIARALIRKSSVLLMDEPISHLDADLRARTRGELARLQRLLKITTVYVTHDQLEALAMSDRIAVMNLGAVQQFGTPDELYNQPANVFVASFIGEPTMNLIPCTLERQEGGKVRLYTACMGFDITLSGESAARIDPGFTGEEVLFGIRPIDFEIKPQGYQPSAGDKDEATTVKGGVLNYEGGCEHAYIEVRVCEYNVLVECSPSIRFEEGEPIHLNVTANRFHIFDRKTEDSILSYDT